MSKKKAGASALCPCGSGLTLAECCGPKLAGEPAQTPEALMRSRYTAYALGDDAYVLATWAPETRPAALFEKGEARPKWIGLAVLSASSEGDEGTVHFVARARTSSGAMRLEEKSRFRRENGRWLYVDGSFD